jgi:hypothetical protein
MTMRFLESQIDSLIRQYGVMLVLLVVWRQITARAEGPHNKRRMVVPFAQV